METEYLQSALNRFAYYKQLGDRTFAQVDDEALFWQYNEDSNSIATIVKHLWGNMLSRWTDFLNSDGEKEWRERDNEFENDIKDRKEMLQKWEEGWDCLFEALKPLTERDLQRTVLIRNEPHNIIEAINRQLTHYAYHIGQIVMLGKMVQNGNWKSLTIPKGQSKAFNAQKFGKRQSHK